jgi:hypothetical protein
MYFHETVSSSFKTCTKCQGHLPHSDFSPNGGNKPGLRSRCRSCRSQHEKGNPSSESRLARRRVNFRPSPKAKREYAPDEPLYRRGLPDHEYNQMVTNQDDKCAICKSVTKLVVDHCHTSGDIRGLLCGPCNRGIGMFRDSTENLEEAIRYLRSGTS